MARGASTWVPDAHNRDLIKSIMLHCALRWTVDDCLALDFGSNSGLHAFAMLQLGARGALGGSRRRTSASRS